MLAASCGLRVSVGDVLVLCLVWIKFGVSWTLAFIDMGLTQGCVDVSLTT